MAGDQDAGADSSSNRDKTDITLADREGKQQRSRADGHAAEVPNQAWEPIEKSSEYAQFKDVVLEDQEIFKQIVKVHTSEAFLLFQYEMSVMEFSP
jgi:hypothetical protein